MSCKDPHLFLSALSTITIMLHPYKSAWPSTDVTECPIYEPEPSTILTNPSHHQTTKHQLRPRLPAGALKAPNTKQPSFDWRQLPHLLLIPTASPDITTSHGLAIPTTKTILCYPVTLPTTILMCWGLITIYQS